MQLGTQGVACCCHWQSDFWCSLEMLLPDQLQKLPAQVDPIPLHGPDGHLYDSNNDNKNDEYHGLLFNLIRI